MENMKCYEMKLNTFENLSAETDMTSGAKIPVNHGSGEILLYVDATGAGQMQVAAGNTVFGGKKRTVEFTEAGKYLVRLEAGPHLIKEGNSCHIQVTAPSAFSACAVELK